MKILILLPVALSVLFLSSCALFPRKDTVAYPAEGGPGAAPTAVFVDKVEVDRRVLAREVARDAESLLDVLAPGNGFPVAIPSSANAWPLRVHIVERETIRDFTPQYAIMVSLEMFPASDAPAPALTVVHTSESTDSISSPWVLKRILNDCLHEAAHAFAARPTK
jgi:hypothetical protein